MKYAVTLRDPALPEDGTLVVPGLGELVNGKTLEISEEQAERFKAQRGVTVHEGFKDSSTIEAVTWPTHVKRQEEQKGGRK